MAIWFDVDDLVRYFCFNVRPTGIQRLSLALFRELQARQAGGGAKTYFCRRQAEWPFFRQVDFPALDRKLRNLIEAPQSLVSPSKPLPRVFRPGWRRHLTAKQLGSLSRIRRALADLAWALRDLVTPAPAQGPISAVDLFDRPGGISFAAGDWLINLGSSWNAPYEPACLNHIRASGAKFGILVYDMIPELFPEWTAKPTLMEFRSWLREIVPLADLLFAISDNTAADVSHCLAHAGKTVPPVARLPIGSPAAAAPYLPVPQARVPFVLMVSTFEVRKNHALMFRVWQKLLSRHDAAQIPDLVFAGKPGWLTGDFLCQLENASWLDGKIRYIESPSDAELTLLYRQCLFTVYPSLYEGWGLPVSESLGFGKAVAASNRASIPEAGGDFCVYFDPENIQEATAVIENLIRHPEHLAAMERHIAQHYRPPAWGDAADILLGSLEHPGAGQFCAPAVAVIHQAA
jgi:glycosyltransferase involved in cell wall biosynthesis